MFKFLTDIQCCTWQLQSTQVHHQATDCRVPWNSVGIQIPDTIPTISAASPSPPAAMPMLMPVFFQQFGTSMLPMIPSFNFELPGRIATSSNLQTPPVSAVSTSRFPAGVDQGTQATQSHVGSKCKEVAALVSRMATSSRPDLGQFEEESDSDWDETKRGSSPSTPSTPLSSPDHKKSLRRAMQLCSKGTSMQETTATRNDPQAFVSEVCQVSTPDGLRPNETMVEEAAPPLQMVTEIFTEETTAEKPILTANASRYMYSP